MYRILESLGTFLDKLNLSSSVQNTSDNVTIFSFNTFALQVQDINPAKFNGQDFLVFLGTVEQAMNITLGFEEDSLVTVNDASDTGASGDGDADLVTSESDMQEDTTATIQLPSTVFDDLENCTDSEDNALSVSSSSSLQRLSYSVFLSDVLFQPENRTRYKVGSIVVSARIRCALTGNKSLSLPIRTNFLTSEGVRYMHTLYSNIYFRYKIYESSKYVHAF